MSFSTLSICGFWLTAAKNWKGTFSAKMRRQAAGVESPALGACLLLHLYSRLRGPCGGRERERDADRKPVLSVRHSHVKAKSKIVLWHVVGRVSVKHSHTYKCRGNTNGHTNILMVHQCVCVEYLHEKHEQRSIHPHRHTHHSISATLNLSLS